MTRSDTRNYSDATGAPSDGAIPAQGQQSGSALIMHPGDGRAHGGRLRQARALFPRAPEPFIDLSTGINPHSYPVPPHIARSFARLPEPEDELELRRIAASAYAHHDPAGVVAAPGTQSLISLLPYLLGVDRHRSRTGQASGDALHDVGILSPTYGGHEQAWLDAGMSVHTAHTLDDLLDCGSRIVVICNPNNPDGRVIAALAVRELAGSLRRQGRVLIVDEAFADLDGQSVAGDAHDDSLIVLRSFGKTYGLAGLRLGFALSGPGRAADMRLALGSWAVSGPAIAVGCQALADRQWLDGAAQQLGAEARLLDRCLEVAGLNVIGGTRLFCLVSHPDAAKLWRHLGEAGILVRRFAQWPHWLRFGLPATQDEWQRLDAALEGARQISSG